MRCIHGVENHVSIGDGVWPVGGGFVCSNDVCWRISHVVTLNRMIDMCSTCTLYTVHTLRQLRHLRCHVTNDCLRSLVVTLVHSRLDYGNFVFVGLSVYFQ